MKNKFIFLSIILGVFAASFGAGYFFYKNGDIEVSKITFITPSIPQKQVQDFAKHFAKLEALKGPLFLPNDEFLNLEGKKVRISDFMDKPTLVNLWATWCAPCVVELPSLERFSKKYEGKMNVVAIAMEQGKDPSFIQTFLEMQRIGDFAGYVDKDGGFTKNLGIRGLPTSFLLGHNGQILYRFEGDAEWDLKDSTEFFDVFLLQNP